MNYYISDLHIGHANAIKFDNRPFADVNEMNNAIIENWNSRVKSNDTVYILGDFIWAKESEWPYFVGPLAGNKVLIRGNHDPRQFSRTVRNMFQDITNLKEIKDDGKHIVMCHYPIPFFRAGFSDTAYMLYGHVHRTKEYEYLTEMSLISFFPQCEAVKYPCLLSFRIWLSSKSYLKKNGNPLSVTATNFCIWAVTSSPPMSMYLNCSAKKPLI